MSTMNPPTTPAIAIAHELVDLCRAGRNGDAIEQLYSEQIVSIEPVGSEAMPAELHGIDAVRNKHKWWTENMEVHSSEVGGPYVGEEGFVVQFTYDTTFKPTGKRKTATELAKYTVANGKIVMEEFFYNADG
ncbi:MAG: nuclear transport factor 2 family protein [bacterium]